MAAARDTLRELTRQENKGQENESQVLIADWASFFCFLIFLSKFICGRVQNEQETAIEKKARKSNLNGKKPAGKIRFGLLLRPDKVSQVVPGGTKPD